ncbi:nuclear transport factor 2 family protein [Streptomyces sp. NPDC005017]|uniref:nuclear transport factor 2 family protein n=1 Tax=Streptomyces sp. NPDC005017 TaxID=3364706 RepID=UPI0036853781
MSWTRRSLAALAVCVLLLTGSAGCRSGEPGEGETDASAAPVGQVLDDRDDQGRPYREVDEEDAPGVGIEVQPDPDGASWDVRLALRGFRFSPPGAPAEAAPGRGFARLYLDGRPVAELRAPGHRLSALLVPRGTHQVTARLYADDGTVWAVNGEPVETTADITASGEEGSGAESSAERTVEPSRSGSTGAPVPSTGAPLSRSVPSVSRSVPSVSRSVPSVSRSAPSVSRSAPSASRSAPSASRSAPSASRSVLSPSRSVLSPPRPGPSASRSVFSPLRSVLSPCRSASSAPSAGASASASVRPHR